MRINPEHIKGIVKLANGSGYLRLLSITIAELGTGFSVVKMALGEKHLNLAGEVHGGAYSSLVDTAAYWALYCDLDDASGLISIDVNVNLLSITKNGVLVAEGKRIKSGRSICMAEAKVFDSNDRLVAYGTSKLMVSKAVSAIQQAQQSLNLALLPPKFLEDGTK